MRQEDMPPSRGFAALLAQRAEIEANFAGPLDWQPLPDRVASRIALHLTDADTGDRSDRPHQHSWILQQLRRFRRVVAEQVKPLRLDELPAADAGQEELAEG